MSDVVSRLSTALADRYVILHRLGEGGMATVYLAEDVKHDRKVALKVLKPELAAVLGAERFVQEIKTTASLQHPNILALFDSGEADGFLYYVMPYIDGESLRDKLDREAQLGIDEAVKIAIEVAEALDHAHGHGVIHRDIKPENILLHAGRPLVADFGIALAVSAAAGGRMTETGLSLGTPHYMSPEQATAEKDISARSDVYSLASVLYEMLTGDPPHTGSVAQQIIMKIVTEEAAPVTSARKSVPPNVAAAVAKALEKLPADRFATAKQFAEALANPGFTTQQAVGVRSAARADEGWERRWAPRLVVFAALAVAAAVWGWVRAGSHEPRPVSRYHVALPDSEALGPALLPRIALLPDGAGLVYSAYLKPGDRLLLRRRNSLHASPIPGTEDGFLPFVSPDGREIGFVTLTPNELKAVSLVGGTVRSVQRTDVEMLGVDWGPDGYVYLGSWNGLMRVPAAGGDLEAVTALDPGQGETGHASPHVLPDGKSVVFTVLRGDDPSRAGIAIADLASGEHRQVTSGTDARYAVSGHLLYVDANRTLFAAPFDRRAGSLTGDPVPIADNVSGTARWGAELALSRSGDLVYVTGVTMSEPDDLVWVTREGVRTEILRGWRGDFSALDLAPDGASLAITIRDAGGRQIWIRELDEGPLRRLTYEGTANGAPIWSPDGRSISFVSGGDGGGSVYSVPADGSAAPRLIAQLDRMIVDIQWSPDGEWLVLGTVGGDGPDILAIRPASDSAPVRIAAEPQVSETIPKLSPDGTWLAYVSNETGRPEIFVRPFPGDGPKTLVSSGGGLEPRWAHSGRALFYRNGANKMTVVSVRLGPTIAIGPPQDLFDWGYLDNDRWVPAPDDQRFLFVRTLPQAGGELIVVENFVEELGGSGWR